MNTKYKNIRVLVARSSAAVDAGNQCDDVRECDTIKEAKSFAKYSLTEAYQTSGEFSEPMNCARVMAEEDGRDVCVADYTRKGYVEPVAADESTEAEADRAPLAFEQDAPGSNGLRSFTTHY